MLREWPKEDSLNKYLAGCQPKGKGEEGQNYLGQEAFKMQCLREIYTPEIATTEETENWDQEGVKRYNRPNIYKFLTPTSR